MNAQLPFLEIHGPEDQEIIFELSQDRTTIGRFRKFNDIGLELDPQQLITRKVHCAIERDEEGWWVTDNGSVNKTLVQRGQVVEIVAGRTAIADGDVIRILARLIEDGEPLYWELTFRDPLRTQRADVVKHIASLEYDWIQAKLFRVNGFDRQEIRGLRPQEHKLIRYMDQRNQANGNVPVLCTNEELIAAIWDEVSSHIESEINHLVWELRKKIEMNAKEPQFLQNERGLGYRLVTRPRNR